MMLASDELEDVEVVELGGEDLGGRPTGVAREVGGEFAFVLMGLCTGGRPLRLGASSTWVLSFGASGTKGLVRRMAEAAAQSGIVRR